MSRRTVIETLAIPGRCAQYSHMENETTDWFLIAALALCFLIALVPCFLVASL